MMRQMIGINIAISGQPVPVDAKGVIDITRIGRAVQLGEVQFLVEMIGDETPDQLRAEMLLLAQSTANHLPQSRGIEAAVETGLQRFKARWPDRHLEVTLRVMDPQSRHAYSSEWYYSPVATLTAEDGLLT